MYDSFANNREQSRSRKKPALPTFDGSCVEVFHKNRHVQLLIY